MESTDQPSIPGGEVHALYLKAVGKFYGVAFAALLHLWGNYGDLSEPPCPFCQHAYAIGIYAVVVCDEYFHYPVKNLSVR